MRVAVVGTGGTGGYFGGRLALAGHDVGFVARGEHLAALRRDGLAVQSVAGDFVVEPVQATDDTTDLGPADVVLVCVKTWQLPAAIASLAPLMSPETAVVTVQNGVDAPAEVAAVLGQDAVLPGIARIFAQLDGPGRVRHVGGPGSLSFAEWDNRPSVRVAELRGALAGAGVATEVPGDIWSELWAKFLFVVPFGSLGAASGETIGVLRTAPGSRALLVDAMREIEAVARRREVALPDDIVATTMAFLDRQPAEGISSLHRDIAAGRPSELDAWAGAVVRLGGETGTPTPIHRVLYELLRLRG